MAEFRIDQATPGNGNPGESRHDLIPGEILTLVATDPLGAGVTYTWEILDKVGSTATLSSTTGSTVTIGNAGLITQPCAFSIQLTVNDNGVITVTRRIASVRTASTGLRVPLYAETAPVGHTLGSNNPDDSIDNAQYPDLAGLGVATKNWRSYAEWVYEAVLAIEALSGTVPDGFTVDDFIESPQGGWLITTENNASVSHGANAAAFGLPGIGVALLEIDTDPDGQCVLLHRGAGMAVGAGDPIIIEFKFLVAAAGVHSDDECEWIIGLGSDENPTDGAVLFAAWDDGTSTRTHYAAVIAAGVPDLFPVTLPALGGGVWYHLRITLTNSAVTMEMGIDDGPLSQIAQFSSTVTPSIYRPLVRLSKDDGDGDRALFIDWVRWTANPEVTSAGSPIGNEFADVLKPAHGPAASTDNAVARWDGVDGSVLKDSPVTISDAGNIAGVADIALSGTVDGRDVSTDGAKLDTINPSDDTPLAPSGGGTPGTGGNYSRSDHVHPEQSVPSPASAAPQTALGTGAAGTAPEYSRGDHVHPALVTVEVEVGVARNVADADSGKVIWCSSGSTVVVTVPTGLTIGVQTQYVQGGAGQVQVVAGGGMAIQHPATFNPYTAELGSSLVVTLLSATLAQIDGDLDPV